MKRLIFFLTYFIPLRWLIYWSKKKIILPYYHIISDTTPIHIRHLYSPRSITLFEDDLRTLKKYFRPASLSEIYDGGFDIPVFHISFDDGLAEVYQNAIPILEKENIKASFYINTAFIDNQDMLYRFKLSILKDYTESRSLQSLPLDFSTYNDTTSSELESLARNLGIDFSQYLSEIKPYMSYDELKHISHLGHTLGSHSHTHPNFSLISRERQIEEISKSFEILAAQLDVKSHFFAFPFGSHQVPSEIFKWLEKSKIISLGTSGVYTSIWSNHYHRIGIESYNNMKMKNILKIELFKYTVRKCFRRHVLPT